ncbi:MAG: restriction endonuclease subunit S [Thermoguttaceae bacterium]
MIPGDAVQNGWQFADPDFVPLNITAIFSPPDDVSADVRQIQEDLPQEQDDNKLGPEGKKKALSTIIAHHNAKVDDWKRIASSSRKDPNVTGSDVAGFPIHLPAKREQQRIAAFFSTLDAGIAAEADRLASLEAYKKGLMQQLFPSPEGE